MHPNAHSSETLQAIKGALARSLSHLGLLEVACFKFYQWRVSKIAGSESVLRHVQVPYSQLPCSSRMRFLRQREGCEGINNKAKVGEHFPRAGEALRVLSLQIK